MNFRATILFLAFAAATEGRLQGQRELALFRGGGFEICHFVDETHYETKTANIFDVLFHVILHQSDQFGSCLTTCETLCEGFSSFESTTEHCVCIEAQESEEVPTRTEEVVVVCAIGFAPSSTTRLCVQTCESQYNPCGPGSECISDAVVGHTCKPQYDQSICPLGCGPHSSCVDGSCACDPGFERRESYLPCQEVP